jgi:hypothetical protein
LGSLRFRRSISLGGGVRLNINKSSFGLSAGTRGIRYSVNTSGQSTRSIGVPGTGLYYRSQTGPRSSGSRGTCVPRPRREQTTMTDITPQIAEQVIPRPGFFASSTERRFRHGLVAYLQQQWSEAVQGFELATAADSRNLSDDFFLGASYARLQRFADAAKSFERVVASADGLPDELMRKYVPGTLTIQLPITERVVVAVGFDSVGAA